MKRKEDEFKSAQGQSVFFRCWLPESRARAAILLVHGLAEHSGRYEEFAGVFTAAGYAVYALDHPGHGRSGGEKGHIANFSEFTGALDRCLEQMKRDAPELPLVLVGHSMGGLISSAFLLERQSEFVAAVLSGPAIRAPEPPSRLTRAILRLVSGLFPRFGIMQLESSGVSRDPEVVTRYENDPLVYRGKITARLAAELFSAMDHVEKNAGRISLPLLIMHGSEDQLTAVSGSQSMHEWVSSIDKDLKIYEGLYHEIFNEPERLQVMDEMRRWLDSRVPMEAAP